MRLILLVFTIILFLPTPSLASINAEFDWNLDQQAPKRDLNVCFHRSMNNDWKSWSTQAIDLWNNVSDQTGWSFNVVPFLRGECDIYIIMRDISETDYRGARLDWIDVLSGQDEKPDGLANAAIIIIDANLEITKDWIESEEDKYDLVRDGWSTIEGEGTRDPIDSIAHQLSHIIRLNHDNEYSEEMPNSDILNPKKPGEHYHALFENDIPQAAESASQDFDVENIKILRSYKTTADLDSVNIESDPFSFGYTYSDRFIQYIESSSITPIPLNIPEGYSHVFATYGFYSEFDLEKPLNISLKYNDENLEPSNLALSTAEGFYTPGLFEDSIALVKFNKETWDLTPAVLGPNPSSWEFVEKDIEFDAANNTVSFQLDEFGLYGLVAIADPEKPAMQTGYKRVLGNEVVGEEEIERKNASDKLLESLFTLIPPILVGFLIGFFIASYNRKK